MINEKMLELSLLLTITEKLPYNQKTHEFYYNDKKYDETKVTLRIYDLVTEFMQNYEIEGVAEEIPEAQDSYVTDTAEKSE